MKLRNKVNFAIWTFISISGLASIAWLLHVPSEEGSSFLWGYSLYRLAIAAGMGIAVIWFAFLAIIDFIHPQWWQEKKQKFLSSQSRLFISMAILAPIFLGIAVILILTCWQTKLELPFLSVISSRLIFPFLWIEFAILGSGLYLGLNCNLKELRKIFFSPLRLSILFFLLTVIYTVILKVCMAALQDTRMIHVEYYVFLPAIVFLVWSALHEWACEKKWYSWGAQLFAVLALGVVIFAIYCHTAQWMDWQVTPISVYWNDLAEAILQGRLYIINPSVTHDLTLYQGNWYVPNPPLPALIYLPFVAIFGKANVNAVFLSICISVVNVIFVYLILERASKLGVIPTRRSGNVLLTILFALGTSQWWLSILGQMWYISQLLTLTFAALAVLLLLYQKSPWWVGASLGLAMLSRPNVFTLWPFLLGIAMYFMIQSRGKLDWKAIILWSIQSAIPVCLAVAGLLYYNYIRFDNFLDFGYVTINGAGFILEAVQKYGMFNVHFIPTNLRVMLFSLPPLELKERCLAFSSSKEGFSMFMTTPALFYLFRRSKKNWFTVGAWVSIVLSMGMLLLYHNTGSWQFGYRYILDFIIPVLLLLAIGVGERPSILFKGLVGVSVLMNLAGILWWFNKWWC